MGLETSIVWNSACGAVLDQAKDRKDAQSFWLGDVQETETYRKNGRTHM